MRITPAASWKSWWRPRTARPAPATRRVRGCERAFGLAAPRRAGQPGCRAAVRRRRAAGQAAAGPGEPLAAGGLAVPRLGIGPRAAARGEWCDAGAPAGGRMALAR